MVNLNHLTIFAECANLTADTYWKQIFEECSKGKFPKGCSIDSTATTLYIKMRARKNMLSYKLGTNAQKIFNDLKELLQEHLEYKSKQDRKDIRQDLKDICKTRQETLNKNDWASIKRKKIKDKIVRRFVLQLAEHYSLNSIEKSNLYQVLKLSLIFNCIKNEDVLYDNDSMSIIQINNLMFNEEEKVFYIDSPEIKKGARDYKSGRTTMSSVWLKHMEKPRNHYVI